MAYPVFDTSKPDPATQGIAAFGQSARDNIQTVRDACILGGGFPGWSMAASGGTASQPSLLTYSKGVERVKSALTWDGNGNVSVAVYSYSADSGTTYLTIGTKTTIYDANQNVTSTTWS